MKRSKPAVYVIVLILLAFIGWREGWFRETGKAASGGDYGLDRADKVVYTRHARCRMGCRHITGEEIDEIIASGKINRGKSDLSDKPCPTIALEGYSHENQHIRVVVATCGDELRVVTCIDLDKDWPCDCD